MSFDAVKYQQELEVCRYTYPSATILLVGLQAGNRQTNISELQALAQGRDIFIIPNSDSLDQGSG